MSYTPHPDTDTLRTVADCWAGADARGAYSELAYSLSGTLRGRLALWLIRSLARTLRPTED